MKGRKQDRHQGRLHQRGDERAKPARPSAGSPIWKYSRISTSLWLLSGYAQAAGGCQQPHQVCAEKSGGQQVRDHRISLSERHCGLCDRAGRRKSADLGTAVPRRANDADATAPTKAEYKVKLSCVLLLLGGVARSKGITTTPRGWSTAVHRTRPFARRLCPPSTRISKGRTTSKQARARARSLIRIFSTASCLSCQLLLHPDLYESEPDQRGHHQQVHPGGQRPSSSKGLEIYFYRESRPRQTRSPSRSLINKRSREQAEKRASEYQKSCPAILTSANHCCRSSWTAALGMRPAVSCILSGAIPHSVR